MKWKALPLLMVLALSIVACTPPKPPCCENVGGRGLHPINPDMMPEEQIKAINNS